MPDDQFAGTAGFDALAYVNFLRLALQMSLIVSFLVLAAVLPTNWTDDKVDELMASQTGSDGDCTTTEADANAGAEQATTGAPAEASPPCGGQVDGVTVFVTDFDKTSLTNVQSESNRMWVHLIIIWIITVTVLTMVWDHYKDQIRWRMLYLAWTRKGDVAHTVYVHDIPGTPQGTVKGRIFDKMNGTLGKLLPTSIKDKAAAAMTSATGSAHGATHVGGDDTEALFQDVADDVYKTESPATPPGAPAPKDAASSVAPRRDLAYWDVRPAKTDFEASGQAAAAHAAGVSMQQIVTREFARTFGADQLAHVAVVKNDVKLRGLVAKYDKLKGQLESLADKWAAALRRGKTVKRKQVRVKPAKDVALAERFGADTTRVDEMELKCWQAEQLLKDIRALQADAGKQETSAAFVTMATRAAQTSAANGLLCYDESLWVTEPAPAPNEVLWANVALRGWEKTVRSVLAWGAFLVVVLFFIPVVAAIQSVVNLNAYAEQSDVVEFIVDAPVLGGIIKAVAPTIVLTVFLILVPILLRLCSIRLTGAPSLGAVDREVGTKYFIFQFIIVFVLNTVAGAAAGGSGGGGDDNAIKTLFDELTTGSDGATKVVNWLGAALPQQAPFFINYILTSGLFAGAIAFLKVPGAAIFFLLSKLAGTRRQKKKLWASQYFSYGNDIPNHTIVLLLMLTFAPVQPFLPLVAAAYFAVNYFYARYGLLYMSREAYQSGGLFWPVIFDQIVVGLFTFLLGNLALLAIKKFPYSVLLIPAVIVLILFRIAAGRAFTRPMKVISAHAAADLDRADQVYDWFRDTTEWEDAEMERLEWDCEPGVLGPPGERYLQPSLRVAQAEHDRLLADSGAISARVDAFNQGDLSVLDAAFMADAGPEETEAQAAKDSA